MTHVYLRNCVAFDVVLLGTEACAVKVLHMVQMKSTVALRVKYRFNSLFTLEFFLPMECK